MNGVRLSRYSTLSKTPDPSGASSTSSSSPRACGCASSAARSTTSTRRPPRHPDRPGRAGRGHHPPRARRHAQRHVPRALRAGPPAGHARPPLGRAGGVERGDVVRRVHRRELPPRRLPRLRRPLRTRRRVHRRRPRAVGLVGRRRDRRRPGRAACSCATGRPGAFEHQRRAVRHPRPLQRAAQPAGPPGDPPGRRQRRRARARRRAPPTRSSRRHTRCAGAGVLRRRQGAAGQVRPRRATS